MTRDTQFVLVFPTVTVGPMSYTDAMTRAGNAGRIEQCWHPLDEGNRPIWDKLMWPSRYNARYGTPPEPMEF